MNINLDFRNLAIRIFQLSRDATLHCNDIFKKRVEPEMLLNIR